MKKKPSLAAALFLGSLSFLSADDPVPVSEAGGWTKEEIKEQRPAVITPPGHTTQEKAGAPPSDAIVFFDGSDLSKWQGRGKGGEDAAKWLVKDGYMEVVRGTGSIQTRDQVEGDCQWHLEWCTPSEVKGNSQGRGNSGVFLPVESSVVAPTIKAPIYRRQIVVFHHKGRPRISQPGIVQGVFMQYHRRRY